MMTLEVTLPDETATASLMADLALLTGGGDTITLSGDLGAGKTTAARAMIRYLADDGTYEVPSPTFTLVQAYDLPAVTVLHADLYRLADASELDELGLAPLPDATLTLIEWPERANGRWPDDRIDIAFSSSPEQDANARTALITGSGKATAKVARLKELRLFLDAAGYHDAKRIRMPGDASTRSYARLNKDGISTILMNAPKRPDGPAIYNGKSYSAAVHLAEDVTPYVAIANGLRSRGVSAPEILHSDLANGFLIAEDFGTALVVSGDPPAPIAERFHAAAELLAELHREPLPETLPVADSVDYAIPAFDTDALMIEISLMPDWYLLDRGVTLGPDALDEFRKLWRGLLDGVFSGPRTWAIRDYHSPNLIWLDGREGTARVGVLDFQDAVLGPPAYDLVSLAQDARVEVAQDLELALVARYVRARKAQDARFDPAQFALSYAVISAQRNTRLLGTFSRLNRRDGKPHYLKHIPRIWSYLTRSLNHPHLAGLKAWYAAHVPVPDKG